MGLSIDDLQDSNRCVDRLLQMGHRTETARQKVDLLTKVAGAAATFCNADEEVHAFWVPGRIEVLGKHTDYVGGRSLLSATGHGFFFMAQAQKDSDIEILDAVSGDKLSFQIDPDLVPEVGSWGNYPQTVARRLARNFPGPLKGARIFFGSDLPQAAGMSSSSAMIVGFYLLLARINSLDLTPEYCTNIKGMTDLSGYLGTIENGQTFGTLEGDRGVGTFGGSEDHTAILSCQPGTLSQYAFCPVRFERAVGLPEGYTFAIASSGVVAEKTGKAMEKYNRASRLAFAGVETWNKASGGADPHLAAAISHKTPDTIRSVLEAGGHPTFSSEELVDRLDHFIAENETFVPGAANALAQGDLETFGTFVDCSQNLGASLLKNQVPETVFLAQEARRLGAVAASAFGAGFGGSVWALVSDTAVGPLLKKWEDVYRTEFPDRAARASFFATDSGPAAFEI
ncbi:MAG: galactokinase [bacterium]|nr:galactokinase [bacterium]